MFTPISAVETAGRYSIKNPINGSVKTIQPLSARISIKAQTMPIRPMPAASCLFYANSIVLYGYSAKL